MVVKCHKGWAAAAGAAFTDGAPGAAGGGGLFELSPMITYTLDFDSPSPSATASTTTTR